MTNFPMTPNNVETVAAALFKGPPTLPTEIPLPPLDEVAEDTPHSLLTGTVHTNVHPAKYNRDGQPYLKFNYAGKSILVHRFLVSVALDRWIDRRVQVDHIDNNPANNRSSNLRVTIPAENMENRRTPLKIALNDLVTILAPTIRPDLDGDEADDDAHGRSTDRAMDLLHDLLEADDNLSDDFAAPPDDTPTPEEADLTPPPEETAPTVFDERRAWYQRRALTNDHLQNLADREAILADLAAGRLDFGPFADSEDPCFTDAAREAMTPHPFDHDPDAFAVCACGALKYHRERLTWFERKGPSWLFLGELPIKRSFNL